MFPEVNALTDVAVDVVTIALNGRWKTCIKSVDGIVFRGSHLRGRRMKAVSLSEEGQMQHWQALLDSAGEGICGLDLEGNCTFANRSAMDMFGFSLDEFVGEKMHDLVHHHYSDGRPFPESECPIYDVVKKNKPLHRTTDTMFRKSGRSFIAELSAHPVLAEGRVKGVVITFRELPLVEEQREEMRRAYEQAERTAAELDAVIENMPQGVYVATKGAEVRTNEAARAMNGDKFPHELKTLERAFAGESSTETAHTSFGWVQSTGTPIVLNGRVVGGVAVNMDVTQTRLQDDALRKSEKLAAVGQLASSIAHEINNPLESITNLLYLIRQSNEMKDVQQYAALAQQELARVTEITLQTLRFHRQHSKPTKVDLAELLRTVMYLYTGRTLVRSIEMDLQLTEAPPVLCLEGEIRQVMNNLVRNALDAMGKGGRLLVRLHPEADRRTGEAGVRLTVADTGEGIDTEIASRLFEPFQTTKEQTGTGLGLWVSKGIVEKHGGRIQVKTRRGEGHGTVFTVWLPVDGSPNLEAPAG
jgi:PAS domain S-box-containing protein